VAGGIFCTPGVPNSVSNTHSQKFLRLTIQIHHPGPANEIDSSDSPVAGEIDDNNGKTLKETQDFIEVDAPFLKTLDGQC